MKKPKPDNIVSGMWTVLRIGLAIFTASVAFAVCAHLKTTPTGDELYLCPTAAHLVEDVISTGNQHHTAITLPGVSIMPENASPAIICHEGIHREQSIRLGPKLWLEQYAVEHLRHGYQNNTFEIEAREKCESLGES